MRLDGPRREERIREGVEASGVAEALAVEKTPDEPHRLVEAVKALPEPGPEVQSERLVLAREPGATDAEHGSSPGDVVERRRDLGRVARVAERVRAHHQAQPDARRARGDRGERKRPLEDRLLPRPEDRLEVVPRPDRVPAAGLRRQRRVEEVRPPRGLAPELGAEPELAHEAR